MAALARTLGRSRKARLLAASLGSIIELAGGVPTPRAATPTSLQIAGATSVNLPESSGAYTSVGTLTGSSPGASITWTLADDAGGRFIVGGPKENELLLNLVQLDRTVATSHSVTLQAVASIKGYQDSAPATQIVTVNVSAVTTPALSTPPLFAADFRHGVTTGAANIITAVTAAFSASAGNTAGLSTFEPVLGNTGPVAQPAARVGPNGALVMGTAGTGTGVLSGDWCLELAGAFCAAQTTSIASKNSSTASFLQLAQIVSNAFTRLNYRSNFTGSTLFITLSTPIPVGVWGLLKVTFASKILSISWNGAALGSVDLSAENGGATTWQFDRLFKTNTVAHSAIIHCTQFAFYNYAPSAGEITSLTAWFEPCIRTFRYVDQTLGVDAAETPWLIGTPMKTLATAINAWLFRPGEGALLKRGEVWINDPITITRNGTSGNYFWIAAYGSGAQPGIFGCGVTAPGSIVDNGDGTRSVAGVAADPFTVFCKSGDGSTAKTRFGRAGDPYLWTTLGSRTLATDKSYTFSGGTVTWRYDGFDFLTKEVRIPVSNTAKGLTIGGNFIRLWEINSMFWANENFRITGSDVQAIRCHGQCAANDNFSFSNTNVESYRCQWLYAGTEANNGGKGDGTTCHSNSTGLSWQDWIEANNTGGVRNEWSTTFVIDGSFIKNNYLDVILINQTSSGAPAAGGLTINNAIIVLGPKANTQNAVEFTLGGGTTMTLTMDSSTVVNHYIGGTPNGVSLLAGATSGHSIKNCIFYGFNCAIKADDTFNVTEDYNDFYLNNFNRQGTLITVGTHSAATNPGFRDATNDDYRIARGGPCDGTANSTATTDAFNSQRPGNGATRCIGAVELPVAA